jgi:hypothetical protein
LGQPDTVFAAATSGPLSSAVSCILSSPNHTALRAAIRQKKTLRRRKRSRQRGDSKAEESCREGGEIKRGHLRAMRVLKEIKRKHLQAMDLPTPPSAVAAAPMAYCPGAR